MNVQHECTISELCAALREQGVGMVVESASCAIVSTKDGSFSLSDNGGEINVDKLNVWELPVSVPTFWFNEPLTPFTVAYRVLCAMQETEIDWTFRVNAEMEVIK